MKIEYDKEVDAAYIYLNDKIAAKEVKKTIQINERVNFDLDKNNKLIGIEILDAKEIISKEVLLQKA